MVSFLLKTFPNPETSSPKSLGSGTVDSCSKATARQQAECLHG